MFLFISVSMLSSYWESCILAYVISELRFVFMNLEALACLKSPISTDFSISFYTSASFHGS